MPPQVARSLVGLTTELTDEGSLSGVDVTMEFKEREGSGPVVALVTFVTPVRHRLVGLHVLLQVTLDCEAFVTNFAGERLLFCVTSLVLADLCRKSECFGAILTLELLLHSRLLSLVTRRQMSCQVSSGFESLRAELTLVFSLSRVTREMIVSD